MLKGRGYWEAGAQALHGVQESPDGRNSREYWIFIFLSCPLQSKEKTVSQDLRLQLPKHQFLRAEVYLPLLRGGKMEEWLIS